MCSCLPGQLTGPGTCQQGHQIWHWPVWVGPGASPPPCLPTKSRPATAETHVNPSQMPPPPPVSHHRLEGTIPCVHLQPTAFPRTGSTTRADGDQGNQAYARFSPFASLPASVPGNKPAVNSAAPPAEHHPRLGRAVGVPGTDSALPQLQLCRMSSERCGFLCPSPFVCSRTAPVSQRPCTT